MAQTDPLIGATAGNYTLDRRIGSGGMGDVYRASQRKVGARVAVKILHATSASDPEALRRFQIEAQAGNRIEHPGVIKVLDAGQLPDGRPYLVMPLLEGRSLADHLVANPRLPIDEACRIGIDVLDAVGAAHAKGFVHRDLKPPNVFLTTEGKVVVLDFGVAKLLASDSPARLTRTGVAIGTPYYMAPEQIKEHGVGPASDVYSVGIVMFEMLCGRLPFDAESAFDVMAGHLQKRPPPPRALRPDIPIPIADVVLTALAKDPKRRFANAAAMRDALRTASAGLRASDPDLGRLDLAATLRRSAPSPEAIAKAKQRMAAASVPPGPPRPGPAPVAEPPAKAAPTAPKERGSRLVTFAPWLIALVAVAIALGVIFGRGGSHDGATPGSGTGSAQAHDAVVAAKPPVDAATVDARTVDPTLGSATNPFGLPADRGAVVITTDPPRAAILIDGRISGITPKRVELTVGVHSIELRKSGYSREIRRLDIEHDHEATVSVNLTRNSDRVVQDPDLNHPFGTGTGKPIGARRG